MSAPLRCRLRALEVGATRARSTSWPEHARAWRQTMEAVFAPLPPPHPDASLTVVLPQFGRLRNAELAAWLALACPQVKQVVVVNDNPAERINHWVALDDPRLRLIDHPRAVGPVCRYFTAREVGGTRFLSLDDDLFLAPTQIAALASALDREPQRVHGFYGQRSRGPGQGFEDNLVRGEGEVDLLNRGYAFTDAHLVRYFELLDELKVEGDEALMDLDDDIPLAFVGEGRPRMHDLGAFGECPTEQTSPGARWRRRRAAQVRAELYERLRSLHPPRPIGPTAVAAPPVWPRSLPWAVALAPTGLPLLVPRLQRTLQRWTS